MAAAATAVVAVEHAPARHSRRRKWCTLVVVVVVVVVVVFVIVVVVVVIVAVVALVRVVVVVELALARHSTGHSHRKMWYAAVNSSSKIGIIVKQRREHSACERRSWPSRGA